MSIGALNNLINGVFEGIPLSKLIIVVFSLIPFLEIHVVIGEEMIMILWTCHFRRFVFAFVGVEVGRFVLTQLVVVVFVVEVFVLSRVF